ncbi:transporter family-2 protein [Bhargavaea ginsengi]|uniref:Transporter family-2 protein n=1 Tax=Bhargavaea ginsengi TaxID=426757 RepID=A0A1H6Z2T2_9BACL|nr:DMT family transporter [Bhargavaea ginsengi]SEJ47708.1 transporter family-2 protein [Bhargavaea ginsengi]
MKLLFPLLALIGGIAVAIQSQVNGNLGRNVGVIEGSFISFLIGTLALFFAVIFFGNGNLLAVASVPKWQLLGGLMGAVYVLILVFSVPKIGVAAALAGIIAGQMIMGAVIDHFGLFGGERFPIDAKKLIAIVLLFVSLYLFNQK